LLAAVVLELTAVLVAALVDIDVLYLERCLVEEQPQKHHWQFLKVRQLLLLLAQEAR
jgi:hypothetical protein